MGGDISTTVMELMNQGGRVSVCGAISSYNAKTPIRGWYLIKFYYFFINTSL